MGGVSDAGSERCEKPDFSLPNDPAFTSTLRTGVGRLLGERRCHQRRGEREYRVRDKKDNSPSRT